jgi:hypothetical protein
MSKLDEISARLEHSLQKSLIHFVQEPVVYKLSFQSAPFSQRNLTREMKHFSGVQGMYT